MTQKTEKIITRFPPSPSGYLHVGGARTAIFNWLYAKKMEGKFVLRIEDTDAQRSTQESVEAIFEGLEWLGISWDDGPYYQSQRTEVYLEYIQKLLDTGNAYYCTCSPEKLEQMREKAMAEGRKPKYDGTCREKNLPKSDDAVVRFKAPLHGATVIEDVIKGHIAIQNEELDDFIILRSDGSPTYNLAVVVDDITMGINTIIRGDDHISNTPKQIMLFNALGYDLPVFGHVPMVLGSDKTRLSKRHGATSVTAYRDMGILPEAMVNYLVRLGWSFGEQEFFTVEELVEKFNLKNIGKSPGVFDLDKLLALNADHMKAAGAPKIMELLKPFMKRAGIEIKPEINLEKVVETLIPRCRTLVEMAEASRFYFEDEIVYDEDAVKKHIKPDSVVPVNAMIEKIEALDEFSEAAVDKAFHDMLEEKGLKFGKAGPPVRIALTGKTASPGIFEIMAVLGREKTTARLRKAAAFIESATQAKN
jgi:glutamyl-tRNA synthetase